MDQAVDNKIVSFIWGIADDVLRDLFVRGKFHEVIMPMCVLRRLDAVLEPTKKQVLDTKQMLDVANVTERRPGLCARQRTGILQHLALHAPRAEEPHERYAIRAATIRNLLLIARAHHRSMASTFAHG